MLDKEIRKSQFAMRLPIATDEEQLPFAEICEQVESGKDFLASDHTLRHCRELWTSPLFLTASPDPEGLGRRRKGHPRPLRRPVAREPQTLPAAAVAGRKTQGT